MSEQKSFQVAGIDGYKAGWLVAIVSGMKRSNWPHTPRAFD